MIFQSWEKKTAENFNQTLIIEQPEFKPVKVSRDTFHFPWKRKFSFFSL